MMMDIHIKPKFEKGYCPDLFSWDELSNVINILPLMTMDRVFVKSSIDYHWDSDSWTTNSQSIPSYIIKDIVERDVLYIREMSRSTKKINAFAKTIEETYNMPTDAHIYMCKNLEAEHPFGIHYDDCDNVIVQCEGETNFKVWDIIKDKNQSQSKMSITETPLLDVDMKPGDVIWIPKSYPHSATSKTPRMSVSFPFIGNPFIGNGNEFIQNRDWIQL